ARPSGTPRRRVRPSGPPPPRGSRSAWSFAPPGPRAARDRGRDGSWLAALSRLREAREVRPPVRLALRAELVQVFPRVDAGVVPVAEDELQRIDPDRLDRLDAHLLLAGLQHLLARPVSAHLRRGRVDAQVFARQLEAAAVVEGDVQHARLL